MKTIFKITFGAFLVLFLVGCTKNFEEINTDPNFPQEVTTSALMTAAQKGLCDDIYDAWWGGRQSMLWAQYWTQRNYTSEDRYGIRQSVNNNYWRILYHDVANLVEVIRLNTDETTKAAAALNGDNNNQIACATILKVWAMHMLVDTYGDIPYSEAFQGNAEEPNYTPAYDAQTSIYQALLSELETADGLIDEGADGFLTGDVIYGGNMTNWKKFGNSLRLRILLRMSQNDYTAALAFVNSVGVDGLIASNTENADFEYIGSSPNNSPMYDAYWTDNRNDFTVAKPFINLLKGVDDTLNGKINPFSGIVDPRLQIFSRKKNSVYLGMPYGMPDALTQSYKSKCPSFYGTGSYNPASAIVVMNPKFPMPYFHYDEVCFMLSEINGWDQTYYENGVRASIEFWRDLAARLEPWDATKLADFNTEYAAYMSVLPPAEKKTVMAQKYLAFYVQGYQAWAEYRRTGEPEMLVKPGEITHVISSGNVLFEPLVSISTIPWRLTYPVQEYTINPTAVNNAATAIGGDEFTTKLFWQPN